MSLIRFGDVSSDPYDDELFFTSRPDRSKPCARCGGSGFVTEPYALRHSVRANLDAARDRGAITAGVIGMFGIFECCREAAELAGRARRSVAFWFNEQLVEVNPGDDPDAVARLWWANAYGETPEETVARR